jgi:hypothetical protein
MFPVACIPKNHPIGAGDPLASLPWWGRWQTHTGNKALLGNLFQDDGLTTPAASDGDAVGGVSSVLGVSGAMTQSTGANKGALHFDSGFPCITSGGSAWFSMPDMSALTAAELFLLFLNSTTGDGGAIYGMAAASVNDPATYIPFSGDSNIYDSFGTTVRKDAISASVLAGWNVYNVSSANGAWRNALNGVELFSTSTNTAGFRSNSFFWQNPSGIYSGGKMIAVFLFNQVLTTDQRAAVNTYLATLHP